MYLTFGRSFYFLQIKLRLDQTRRQKKWKKSPWLPRVEGRERRLREKNPTKSRAFETTMTANYRYLLSFGLCCRLASQICRKPNESPQTPFLGYSSQPVQEASRKDIECDICPYDPEIPPPLSEIRDYGLQKDIRVCKRAELAYFGRWRIVHRAASHLNVRCHVVSASCTSGGIEGK